MTQEILLYSPIYSSTASDYITKLEANKGNNITVRMNCPGGDVYAAYGMIAKFNEHTKGKTIKVDGMAASAGFYMCCASDDNECLSVSDFVAHRASAPSWVENDPKLFTDDVKASLNKVNANLRAIIETKIGAERFKMVTGTSLDDMFSLDSRIDVEFNAVQAKKMGLVKKVNPLTAETKTQIMALAATCGVAAFSKEPQIEGNPNQIITKKMTAAELKAAHPEAYAEIMALGAAEERDRVGSWMAFNEVDPVAVKAGIEGGKDISKTQMSELSLKAHSKQAIREVEGDGAPTTLNTNTPAPGATVEAKAKEDFRAEFKNNLKNFRN